MLKGLVSLCVALYLSTATAAMHQHSLMFADNPRTLRVYVPSGSTANLPVIVMHDAQNLFDDKTSFAGEWQVDESMAALFKSHGFRAIVVGIDNGPKRVQEYSVYPHEKYGAPLGESYLSFIADKVLPFINAEYQADTRRDNVAMIGSSMGGLISFAAMQHIPSHVSKLGILSPSYWYSANVHEDAERITQPFRIYTSMGALEGDDMLKHFNDVTAKLSENPNLTLQSQVVPDAKHNEAQWRALFKSVVIYLFELKEPN